MRKKILRIILLAGIFLAHFKSVAQGKDIDTIEILSLENQAVKVKVSLNNLYDKIFISLPTLEKICFSYSIGLNEIKLLGKHFIAINYQIRQGTNQRRQRTIVIGVSNGKLIIAADMISFRSYDFTRTYIEEIDSLNPIKEEGQYELNILSFQDDKQGFSFTAREYEKIDSKNYPYRNMEISDTIIFNFDKNRKIFYTQLQNLQGSYELDSEEKKVIKQNKYPVIKLQDFVGYWAGEDYYYDQEYYFIDDNWFGHNRKMSYHLSEISPLCK